MTTARPHPVVTSATLAGLGQSVVLILAFLGYTDQATALGAKTQSLAAVGIALVTLGGNLMHALAAEQKVTPVADPKTADGHPLVAATVPPAPPTISPVVSAPNVYVPMTSTARPPP